MTLNNDNLDFLRLGHEYQEIANQSPHMMIRMDEAGLCKSVNPAGEDVFGVRKDNWAGQPVTRWISIDLNDLINKRNEKETEAFLVRASSLSNNSVIEAQTDFIFLCIPHIQAEKWDGFTLIEKERQGLLHTCDEGERLADEDPLTRMPNRRYFMRRLQHELNNAADKEEKLAILFIDLDRFKYVNDTLGHWFGDRVLVEIADRLSENLPSNSVMARMGGDEFIVLMPSVQSKKAPIHLTERLLTAIRKPIEMDGYEFTLTGSIGIALYPESGRDAESLLTSADTAMYRAKANGTDRVEMYDLKVNQEFYEYFHVENDLRKALERDEFELYFQPQFNVQTGELCGEEVLVRWQHPVHGTVGPGKFITIAEETGLIVPIGEWVLRTACTLKNNMLKAGYPEVPMSVNLSLKQFLQKNIVHTVEAILQETELPPKFLDLEVTESVTVDLDRTLDVLNRLIKLGVRISLDDFGTGYSSLQYVSRLPVHELKIDQSFVQNIGNDKRCEAIVSMIIHLGHSLGLQVIAEGVETEKQLLFLKECDCDFIQGYYYSKPLTTDQYKAFLQE